jgi:hypothetical protein
MMPDSVWAELGVAATTDRSAIRRAYATRLRDIQAAADDEAFQRLRRAYEQALSGIAHSPGASDAPFTEPRVAPVDTDSAIAPAATPTTEEIRLQEQEDDAATIAAWLPLFRPLATDPDALAAQVLSHMSDLSLMRRASLEHQLALALMEEERLSADGVAEVAKALSWNDEVGLDRRGGIFLAPQFRARLYSFLAQQEAPIGYHRQLSLFQQIQLSAVFVLPAWIAARLLRHAFPASGLDRLLSDFHLLVLWLLIAAGLVLRRIVLPILTERRRMREARRTRQE